MASANYIAYQVHSTACERHISTQLDTDKKEFAHAGSLIMTSVHATALHVTLADYVAEWRPARGAKLLLP